MNKILLGFVSATMLFSIAANADEVITTTTTTPAATSDKMAVKLPSQAVEIRQQGSVYVVTDPTTVVAPNTDLYYFSVNGKNLVCFTKENAHLVGLEVISFQNNSQATKLYCTSQIDQFTIQQ